MRFLNNIEAKIIDYQELYFLSKENWEHLIIDAGNPKSILNKRTAKIISNKELPIISKHEELKLVGGFAGIQKYFFPYVLLEFDNEYQRIHLHNLRCSNCDWEGMVGNPKDPDLYIGIPKNVDKFKVMKQADKFERKPCPKCKTPFTSTVIWVGEKS